MFQSRKERKAPILHVQTAVLDLLLYTRKFGTYPHRIGKFCIVLPLYYETFGKHKKCRIIEVSSSR